MFVAGGPTSRGSLRIVKHYRGNQLVEEVDLYDLLLHGVKSDLRRLENGDSVLVPPIGPQVTVDGMVRRPAIYELKDEKNLASVLELAGGLLPTATLQHIEVQRLVEHQNQTMLSVDIPESDDKTEATKKLEAFEIHDGDRIRVFPIVPYNQDAVYLEGHVVRPGRYSYRKDMRVTDVLPSYKDMHRIFIRRWKASTWRARCKIRCKHRCCNQWTRFGSSADSISRTRRLFRCGAMYALPARIKLREKCI